MTHIITVEFTLDEYDSDASTPIGTSEILMKIINDAGLDTYAPVVVGVRDVYGTSEILMEIGNCEEYDNENNENEKEYEEG